MNTVVKIIAAGIFPFAAGVVAIKVHESKKSNAMKKIFKEQITGLESENSKLKSSNDELKERYKKEKFEADKYKKQYEENEKIKDNNDRIMESIEEDPYNISDEELLGDE